MSILLGISGILVGLFALAVVASAKTSVGEIQGIALLIVASVLFTGGALISAIEAAARRFEKRQAAPVTTPESSLPRMPRVAASAEEIASKRRRDRKVWLYTALAVIGLWILLAAVQVFKS